MLPGCAAADWESYQATATTEECRGWDTRSTLDPCPPSCRDAFQAVSSRGALCALAGACGRSCCPWVLHDRSPARRTIPSTPLQLSEECYTSVADFTWRRLGVSASPSTLQLYV